MKRQRTRKLIVPMALILLAALATLALAVNYTGTTIVTFSANPATLSGDSAPDVTITSTTTASGAPEALIDAGKVVIQLATDGAGNPVPAASVVTWVALNAPGQNPASGVTTLDVDLDALGFICGTVAGFRAHYVTGGGQDKVDTHFSTPVDLTAVCECECEATESAYAYSGTLGTCFMDLGFSNWGWSIGPLAPGEYVFPIYAGAGQCDLGNGTLVGQLLVSYADGTLTATYDMDSCRTLLETHLYVGSLPVPIGPDDDPTVAPGQYGNIHDGEEAPNAESDGFVVSGLSGDVYLIAHATVCVPESVEE